MTKFRSSQCSSLHQVGPIATPEIVEIGLFKVSEHIFVHLPGLLADVPSSDGMDPQHASFWSDCSLAGSCGKSP